MSRPRISQDYLDRNRDERIMRAVIAHVAELGYEKASVSALVRRAGVARKTFYTAFRGKEHAFTAAFEWIVERVEVEVRESGDVVGAPEGTRA